VYCGPQFSSKWSSETNTPINTPADEKRKKFKEYIFERASQLKHVYLAGGEPLLMKENLEFLQLLQKVNPDVNLRVNTNLSNVDTGIFDLVCTFKNVHWTVSVETTEQEYEYIRYGGTWQHFVDNLLTIKQLNHKISFNMLYFLLNARSLFDCVDFLKSHEFHNNSFIVGALSGPEFLDIRNLPDVELDIVKSKLQTRIDESPGFLLENGYKNLLNYIKKPMKKNLALSIEQLKIMDQRRGINSKDIFKNLYQYE
jgi:sulfatase maturation enzyme AslB (radical SAM superfamily)